MAGITDVKRAKNGDRVVLPGVWVHEIELRETAVSPVAADDPSAWEGFFGLCSNQRAVCIGCV